MIPLPTIRRDNNEQFPLSPFLWSWRHGVARRLTLPVVDVSLQVGDYEIAGISAVVERKSMSDLWGTCYGLAENDALGAKVKRVDRFRRELDVMATYARKWILIEGSVGTFEALEPDWLERAAMVSRGERLPALTLVDYARMRYFQNKRRGRPPEVNVMGILGLVSGFSVDYGISVEWAPSRQGAEMWLGMTYARLWDQHMGGDKAYNAMTRGLTADRLPWLRSAEQVTWDSARVP